MNKNLTNPFEIHSEQKLLSVGIIITLMASFISVFVSARFDGLLDMHFVESITIYQPLIDNILNVFIAALILFAIGKYLNPKTRFIDILTVSLVSRIPYYPLILINIDDFMTTITATILENSNPENIDKLSMTSLGIVLIFALLALTAVIWYIILLYRGFKVATNSKGNSAIAYFIVSIILIEFITKMSIQYLN